MANSTTFTPSTAEQKAQKADDFLKRLQQPDATWSANSVARYEVPMNMLVDSYREKLCSSILKRHKALSTRDISFLSKGKKSKVTFYTNIENFLSSGDYNLTYEDAIKMQRDAWLGKYDKKFITAFLDSCNAYLATKDKKKASKTA